jgi:hypothetical protein
VNSLNDQIQEYQRQLDKGSIQEAYRGIMAFMSSLKSYLDNKYPDYSTSALYYGYMDMSYFAFTPPSFKILKLKIAIVYLHESGEFEVWLTGSNRKIQAEYIRRLKDKNIGEYKLTQIGPGVDSIIESILVEHANFDDQEKLIKKIEEEIIKFMKDMVVILEN